MTIRSLCLAVSVLTCPVLAQWGVLTGRQIDVTAVTGNDRCTGVVRTVEPGVGERFFVSASTSTNGASHVIYEIDASGTLINTYPQLQTLVGSFGPFGISGMAWDGADIVYGIEQAQIGSQLLQVIRAFRLSTRSFDVNAEIRPTGVPGNAPFVGLAYDSASGTFYSSHSISEIVYAFDRSTGAATALAASGTSDAFGLGYDPVRNRLLLFSRGGGLTLLARKINIKEWDVATQSPVGTNTTYGDLTLPTTYPTPGGESHGMDVYQLGGVRTGIVLQSTPGDVITEIDLQLEFGTSAACNGSEPAALRMCCGPYTPGSTNFGLDLVHANCAANGVAFFFVSLRSAPAVPLPPPFLPGSNILLPTSPLGTLGFSPIDAAGTARYTFTPLFALPPITGLVLAFQAGMIGPGGTVATSSTGFHAQLR